MGAENRAAVYEADSNLAVRVTYAPKGPEETEVCVTWDEPAGPDAYVELRYRIPSAGIQYCWHPTCHLDRPVMGEWRTVTTQIARSAPVFCLLGSDGFARYTLALSDCARRIETVMGIHEEDACIACRIRIPLEGLPGTYRIVLRESWTQVALPEALDGVRAWWEALGMVPMAVPEAARLPVYSTWYSYHQAVIAADIEAECRLAAALGMHTVIVDDGWQTDDGNRGYGYCGDWRPTPRKIPDMCAHVRVVQGTGLKYMLWYSVPFIGRHAQAWDRFEGKLLYIIDRLEAGVLDPRYPDVRAYLVDTYVRALVDWNLDGFKLDFIDSFQMGELAKLQDPAMDIPVLEEAVRQLMTDAQEALVAIKPQMLIEFRQSYIGPLMRTYGNMFRVADCPASELRNRIGVIDLRLLGGDTAVHSDMIMWHPKERVEDAARQVLTALFGVAQISMRLAELPQAHRRMLRFWLGFMQEHVGLLQRTPLAVEAPHLYYPVVMVSGDMEAAVAVYDANHVVHLLERETVYLINAAPAQGVVVDMPQQAYAVTVYDCMGVEGEIRDLAGDGLTRLPVPPSGMAVLHKHG